MLKTVLKDLGLNDKEIHVYLNALEIGTKPASVIARRVKIPRNTTRFLLDKLVSKGFVQKSTKANTQLYTPEKPENLIKLLERQRREKNANIDKQIDQVKKIVKELESRYRPETTKPKVAYYDGEEGLIKVYEDTLKSSETLRSFACYDVEHEGFPDYFKNYYKKRVKNKIPIRCIHIGSELGKYKTLLDAEEWRESRLLPPDKYYFTPEVQLYDNKVTIASWIEELGIIIESQEVYEVFRTIFELAWKEADRLDIRKKKGEKIFTLNSLNSK
jgi:sugar-specific transcriptional regulator TrmB